MTKYDKEIVVDLWKTGAHKIEVGIKKEEVLRSKSRQFTKDTDIIGEVKKDGDLYGYVSYRETPWELEDPNKQIVIKLFTKSINWKASLEQLVAKSFMQSIPANRAMPVFMININNTDHLITLEKTHRKPSIGKSIFAFNIIDDDNNVNVYAIETDRLSLGSDWFVFDEQRNKIAVIDGSKFNIGGKYTIKIDTKSKNYDSVLDSVLILFSALNRFLGDVDKHLNSSVKKIKKGEIKPQITNEEAMLYLNPRRIKT